MPDIYADHVLLYGEPSDDDDYLCNQHGCRLTMEMGAFVCLECRAEQHEAEQELLREEMEQEERHVYESGGSCTYIWGDGFSAFQCTMPWWA